MLRMYDAPNRQEAAPTGNHRLALQSVNVLAPHTFARVMLNVERTKTVTIHTLL